MPITVWHWSSIERHCCEDKGISTQYENNSCLALRLLCREGTRVAPLTGLITIQIISAATSEYPIIIIIIIVTYCIKTFEPSTWPHPITSLASTHLSLSEELLQGNEVSMQHIRNTLDTLHGSIIFIHKSSQVQQHQIDLLKAVCKRLD